MKSNEITPNPHTAIKRRLPTGISPSGFAEASSLASAGRTTRPLHGTAGMPIRLRFCCSGYGFAYGGHCSATLADIERFSMHAGFYGRRVFAVQPHIQHIKEHGAAAYAQPRLQYNHIDNNKYTKV